MRLIDADTVVTIQVYDDMTEETDMKKMTIAEAIDEWSDEGCPPTVDAEPVRHGHWVEVQRIHEKDHTAICECSLCGDTVWVYDGQRAWNYCPNCGAYMGVVKHETC